MSLTGPLTLHSFNVPRGSPDIEYMYDYQIPRLPSSLKQRKIETKSDEIPEESLKLHVLYTDLC